MYEKINSLFKFLFSTKAFRIVSIYLALSLFWIFSTDKLVFNFISDAETQNLVSSIKGWFFVIATTLLLYHLIRRALIEVTTVEQKLIESEIKFRSVFENSVDAIGVSKEGIHVFVNPAYLALFGYSHIDELVGKPVIDLIAPSQREHILDFVTRRAKGEVVPSNYETVGLRKNGSEFDMDVNVSSYHLHSNLYTLVILRDITERKKTEDAIRVSEERWRSLVQNAPNIILSIDQNEKITFINKVMPGFDLETVIGKSIFDFVLPESVEVMRKSFQKVFATGEPENYSVMGDGIDKKSAWYSSRVGAIKQDGKVISLLIISSDITAQKEAEEAIRESEEKFRVLTESTSAAIFIFKGEQFRYLNSYAELLTGYTKEELINKKFWEIVHPDYRNLIKERGLARLRGETVASRYEFKIVTKAGEERWLDFTAGLIQFEGEPSGIGTAIDITERKRAFEELQKSRQEYRALSAHLQRIREDERASIARELHDELGQILTSLKMNIAFTRRELEESESIEIKNKMLSEFQAMNLTIDKAVSEVRKLITQLRPELLDKLGLIAALEWYSEEYQKTTKINCVFTSDSEELFLNHDLELAVFRIVQEAMTNAAKHSDAKSVQIMLGKRENKLSIEIIDDGKGILETELDGTTSFGLLGMRERASIIGGNLEIFGAPGKGTTVRLVIGDYKQRSLRGYNTTNDV